MAMNPEMMQMLQSLPPEQLQEIMAKMQGGGGGMPPAPGMGPIPGMGQEPQQDPMMGLPGQNNEMNYPGSKDTFKDWQGAGDIISQQQAEADALRGTATPEGMSVGNQYVAANPLQHVATAGQRIMGNIDAKKAAAAAATLSEDKGISDKTDSESEFRRKQEAESKILREQEMRNNRRGGTVMDVMAANQGSQGFA